MPTADRPMTAPKPPTLGVTTRAGKALIDDEAIDAILAADEGSGA